MTLQRFLCANVNIGSVDDCGIDVTLPLHVYKDVARAELQLAHSYIYDCGILHARQSIRQHTVVSKCVCVCIACASVSASRYYSRRRSAASPGRVTGAEKSRLCHVRGKRDRFSGGLDDATMICALANSHSLRDERDFRASAVCINQMT